MTRKANATVSPAPSGAGAVESKGGATPASETQSASDGVDQFQKWCDDREFPAEVVIRNNGMASASVGPTGSFLSAGGSAPALIHDEEHAAEVMLALAEINASQAGFVVLSIDGVPDELVTMKGD